LPVLLPYPNSISSATVNIKYSEWVLASEGLVDLANTVTVKVMQPTLKYLLMDVTEPIQMNP